MFSIEQLYSRFKSKKTLAHAHQRTHAVGVLGDWARTLSANALQETFRALGTSLDKEETLRKGFALIREAARRTLDTPHFDVQLLGGTVLLEGKLAEMRTGEGKTLTVTIPAAMLALHGKGVHVVTANAYLAQRDAELMRPVYEALGLSVAALRADQTIAEKQNAYRCDVVYGVGSEFGFDYLKDHLVRASANKVQRELFAAIVDEVDSVLIDEARVPLIISGAAEDKSDLVRLLDRIAGTLDFQADVVTNLKERTADLTNEGYAKVEAALVAGGALSEGSSLYSVEVLPWVRQLHSSVKAHALFKRDRDYVVEGGELLLVDIGTGRKMPGRRFDDGLHEALEAKEGLVIQQGTVTKATITYQNYFSKYTHLSGLTGTAATDTEEFSDLYSLEVVTLPTNRPLIRKVLEDQVYRTKSEKFGAVIQLAQAVHDRGQPLLIGCASIRDAEVLHTLMAKKGIPHETLTAKHIEREAHIIANAGTVGAVTIATNMAGRGTDILLGGEKPIVSNYASSEEFEEALKAWSAHRAKVQELGGLFVLGTERNGLRRVDNQLAGRCGRQGDPGTVQFYLSLEDELLKVFTKNKQLLFAQNALTAGDALKGETVAKLVASSQKNFESQGFSARKSLMKFDSALADQRQAVFDLRNSLLEGGAAAYVLSSATSGFRQWLDRNIPEDSFPETWDLAHLKKSLFSDFGLDAPLVGWVTTKGLEPKEIRELLLEMTAEKLAASSLTDTHATELAFNAIDSLWEEHLGALAELRDNVSFKGHTGLNATFQFHNDAFALFKTFSSELNHLLSSVVLKGGSVPEASGALPAPVMTGAQKVALELEKRWVGRNSACPCGSGNRFKACHGRL